jgi:hypothetical protein
MRLLQIQDRRVIQATRKKQASEIAVGYSETSVNFNRTTRRHIQEKRNLRVLLPAGRLCSYLSFKNFTALILLWPKS